MRKIYVALITLAIGVSATTSAYAHDSIGFGLNIGIPGYYAAPPVVYYNAPPAVYYNAPPPVYYRSPAPWGYYGYRHFDRDDWGHRGWGHEGREHGGWGHEGRGHGGWR